MKYLAVLICFALFIPAAKADGYALTPEDRAFFNDLKSALIGEQKEQVASFVAYPVSVYAGEKEIVLKNAKEFLSKYNQVITAKVRSVIQHQNPDDLVKNWRGVMVGDGEMWFARIKPDGAKQFEYKIIAFSP